MAGFEIATGLRSDRVQGDVVVADLAAYDNNRAVSLLLRLRLVADSGEGKMTLRAVRDAV
jgi:hypothetical protein